MHFVVLCGLALCAAALLFLVYLYFIVPWLNPMYELAGPPLPSFFGNHLDIFLKPVKSPRVHEICDQRYGKSFRIRGVGPWEPRLVTTDPVAMHYVLKNSQIYEKPWQSRRLITSLIGCGMLSAEGQVHKRQRRVATPAFSIQNMRALEPVVFHVGNELKDKWMSLIEERPKECANEAIKLDVCHWVSRATFDVIGLAGFDYHFNAIQNEDNELFAAYKEMFEVAVSQGSHLRTLVSIYLPQLYPWLYNHSYRTIQRCHGVIHRVAGQLIQEKKRKIIECEKEGSSYTGRDLLSLLIKSNMATDLPPKHRINDEDLLHNINTFLFAGSDTSSLTVTWALWLLAQHPQVQTRLRTELLSVLNNGDSSSATALPSIATLTDEEIQSLYSTISTLPYLHNVTREVVRLIPPVHSSIRVATQDDVIPTMYPVHKHDGTVEGGGMDISHDTTASATGDDFGGESNDGPKNSKQKPSQTGSDGGGIKIAKGSFIHVSIEAFNLDKTVWGEDAWEFNPDRWDNLPPLVQHQPGLFSNTLTFSAGPRSCIGMRFSIIEIKTFLYILLTNFVFQEAGVKIFKANVVLTRPYISGQFTAGSQLPLLVSRYDPAASDDISDV
ncbi:hypothetical protein AX16_007005 [Volvariella volvacea WC 439]|nr:hypothetical protein AX16_007005 [Volvariella volvacea WC 439]